MVPSSTRHPLIPRRDENLLPRRWALWNARESSTLEVLSTRGTRIQVPDEFRGKLPKDTIQSVIIPPQCEALLYIDERLVERLAPGAYHLCVRGRNAAVHTFSLRAQEAVVAQQDVLSKDKISLRLSAVVRYRIADCALAHSQHADIAGVIYSNTQLAMRRLVADKTLDQLLEQRAACAETLGDDLRARLASDGVDVQSAELRDMGVPAAMRTLLHRVIEAEKQAQANLIHRREETAATRALANTARLLENNPTLARLKELEAWREIAAKVATVNVVASTQGLLGAVLPSGSPSRVAQPASSDAAAQSDFDE